MNTLWQDLRYAWRMLRRNPGFTVVAVTALALGIGANSAIFTVVNSVLLRPLPYKAPDRLIWVWQKPPWGVRNLASGPDFLDWREQNQVFEQLSAIHGQMFNITGTEKPERVMGAGVSAGFFSLLGVEPALGRAFTAQEDRPGGERVALLSHGLWQRSFGGDASLVGKTLNLNSQSHTVIGILPPGFEFLTREFEVWTPLALNVDASNRGTHYLRVLARLKTEVPLEQAQAAMTTIARRIEAQNPATNQGWGVALERLQEQIVGEFRPALLVLLGVVVFVLLIACANVANLLLARATARQKEIAVRRSLGASRGRLMRQLLTESVLLALLGAGAGLALGAWGVQVLVAISAGTIPRVQQISIDWQVFVFTLLVAVATGLVFGLAPAREAFRTDLNQSLKEGGRGTTPVRRGARGALVAAEMALAVVTLAGAGLLIKSFLRLLSLNPGFRPDNVLTLQLTLPQAKYPEARQVAAFYQQALARVEALPGVESAGAVTGLPVGGLLVWMPFVVEGAPLASPADRPRAGYEVVTPGYFRSMGIPLVKGRYFTERDTPEAPAVAIVSQALGRRYWPGEDPVGRRMVVETVAPGQVQHGAPVMRQIVGIAGDVKRHGRPEATAIEMYVPYLQNPLPFSYLAVRAAGDPLKMLAAVRNEIQSVDRDLPVADVRTMEARLADAVSRPRLNTLLMGVFAVLALALAAVGMYGVMAYMVGQRTHEIGLRMALGAQPADVFRLVVGQGLALAGVGAAIGLGLAAALGKFLAGLLYGVSARDPVVFLGVTLVLVAVALVATYVPARRAARVDPMVALRHE